MALQSEDGVRGLPPGDVDQESPMEERETRSHSGFAADTAAPKKAADAGNEDAPSARAAQQPTADAENGDPVHATPNVAGGRAANAAAAKETPHAGEDEDDSNAVEKARYTDVDRRNPTGGPGSASVKAEIQSTSLFREDAPAGNHAQNEAGAAASASGDGGSTAVREQSNGEDAAAANQEASEEKATSADSAAKAAAQQIISPRPAPRSGTSSPLMM
eukprot:1039076-Rhodomonas_salina.2